MQFIVGIDEVGRGPLAGPVSVGVVCCQAKIYSKLKRNKQLPPLGMDSKRLSPRNRQKYSDFLKVLSREGKIFYSINHVSNKVVDSKGISFAIGTAISKGINKLKLNPKNCQVLLDGGLRVPKEFKRQKTIIKGDQKEKIIAWASIMAKVSRDKLISKIGKKYPQYGFEFNKGYGTLKHRVAIRKNGLSKFHRRTFHHS